MLKELRARGRELEVHYEKTTMIHNVAFKSGIFSSYNLLRVKSRSIKRMKIQTHNFLCPNNKLFSTLTDKHTKVISILVTKPLLLECLISFS